MLTKSDYLKGLQCPRYIWFLKNKPEALPKETNIQRMEMGIAVGKLATKLFPEGISIEAKNSEENAKVTQELLKKNVPLFEAGFLAKYSFARIDILQPNKDGSFNIIEVKSGTKIKEEHLDDVAFQRYCCELAGLKIKECFLCIIDKDYVRQDVLDIQQLFKLENITAEVIKTQQKIDERIAYLSEIIEATSSPERTEHCTSPKKCPGETSTCWKDLPKNNVFYLVRGGKKSNDLFNEGIIHIADIPPDWKLSATQHIQQQATQTGKEKVDVDKIRKFLDTLQYPIYYLDFETIGEAVPRYKNTKPYQNIPFQFSVHLEQKDGSISNKAFLAENRDDPREALLVSLKNALGKTGHIVVYNQSFEKKVLRELALEFPQYEKEIEEIVKRIVDLHIPFREFSYYHPNQEGSTSIKKVLPALTEENYEGMDIAGGEEAALSYLKMMFGNVNEKEKEKIREDLEKYCALDTYACVLIVRKLREICGVETKNT